MLKLQIKLYEYFSKTHKFSTAPHKPLLNTVLKNTILAKDKAKTM